MGATGPLDHAHTLEAMSRLVPNAVACFLTAMLWLPRPAMTQTPASTAFVPLTESRKTPGLATPVTLELTDATVADAVSAIPKQTGLSVTYDATTGSRPSRVNVDSRRRIYFSQGSEIWIPRLPTFGITYEFGGTRR